ncbi:MAG: T9SS type A sorting domain-containing protein [Saprospiraceae bacterium]|nr:T9SS type A sorting domain-containing protein [Saprospiraceae bacterium]MDW8482845.1 T9SS type A sorting domain-containing protein [Saprospiraceae bacterium]
MRSLLLLLLLLGVRLWAQQPPGGPFPCPKPFPGGALYCEFACVLCDFDSIVDQTNIPLPPPLPSQGPPAFTFCALGTPPMTLERPRWYGFVAGSESIGFWIRNLGCTSGTGIEAAIAVGCQFPNVALTCGPVDPLNPLVVATGLTIGRVYYLVVDGIDNANCRYEIRLAFGSTKIPLGPLDTIQGLKRVCPNATTTYSISPVPGAISYTWTTPPNSKINGTNSNVITLPASPNVPSTIQVEFANQGGAICVTANSACDTPKSTCILVTNQPLPITQLPDRRICFEELPFFWEEEPFTAISAPGTYVLTSTPYTSYLGCDSVVRQRIIAQPRKLRVLPLKRLCNDECFEVNGFPYCETGSYQEVMTAEDGCDSTVVFSILKVRARAGIQRPDTINCRRPIVTLRADSLTTTGNSVFYKWLDNLGNTISNSRTVNVETAGPFYFIVNNVSGGLICSDTAEVTVPVNVVIPNANGGPDRIITCEEPVIQLQGVGPVGPQYSYLWIALEGGNIVSGSTTLKPVVNAAGRYRLRVTDEINGCTQTDDVLVKALTIPPSASATGSTVSCAVTKTTVSVNTNANAPTFEWSGPGGFFSTQQNPTVSAPGTYTVVVRDGNTGCTNSAVAVVQADTVRPTASASGGELNCVIRQINLVGSSSAANASFAWTGPGGFTSNIPNPIVSLPGIYSLTVTTPNGCTGTASALVSIDTIPPQASVAVLGTLNCKNSTVNLVASSNIPIAGRTHLWRRPDGIEFNTGTTPNFEVSQPGTYTLVITDESNSCTASATVTVVQRQPVSVSLENVQTIPCFGQETGSITASPSGGDGTYSFAWSNGKNSPEVKNLPAGIYTVTVTDGEGCSATASAAVTQPPLLTVSVSSTPQLSNGSADGTATATPEGGTPIYTYSWNTGDTTAVIENLLPGTYTVTVTDANGCTAVGVTTVSAYNCTIDATVTARDASCKGANDGSATVNILQGVSPFTYSWSNGDTTSSVNNLPPGSYTVEVVDGANCPKVLSFIIAEPPALIVSINVTSVTRVGGNDGSASVEVTGGTSPYSYTWSNGDSTQTIVNLVAGIYTVTVTDANGCTATQTAQVQEPPCAIVTAGLPSPVLCNGEATGSATVAITGGTPPFTYRWSSGGNAQTETNLTAGVYTVTVVDSKGCEATAEVVITEPPALNLSLDTVIHTECLSRPEGSIAVSAKGGTGAVAYKWSSGQVGPQVSGLGPGIYTVTATDDNGCTTTTEASIDVTDTEPPVIQADILQVFLGPSGSVTLNLQNLPELSISDNCLVKEVIFEPKAFNCSNVGRQPLVIIATDEVGNVTRDTVTVSVNDTLPPKLTCPKSIVRCANDNVVQYPAPVAVDNCLGIGGSFDLVEGLPSGSTFPIGTTRVTYAYTDAGGNVGSCTFEVTILTPLVITLDTILPDKGNLGIGAVRISVSGSLSPYTFQWFRNGQPLPDTTQDLDSIRSGAYTVLVTDELGCTATAGPFVVDSLSNVPNQPAWSGDLLIMPNPTAGLLHIIFPEPLKSDVELAVFDLTGRLILRQNVESPHRFSIDLVELADGLYTLFLRVQEQTIVRKIVLNKKY